jgi:hypothetical protein
VYRFLLLAALAACHPRLSVGYDVSAHTRGPLGNLQSIPRLAALDNGPTAAPAPPEGRTYDVGLGFGDKRFQVGLAVHANDVSGAMIEPNGPRYMSAVAAAEFRFSWLKIKNVSSHILLSPTRTLLVDSMTGDTSWGSGIRYGGGFALALKSFSVYMDAYQEELFFTDGPAVGNSSRAGMTLGLAYQH